jgi:hypothetical protein
MGRSISASDLAADSGLTLGRLAAQLDARFTALVNGEAVETLELEDLRTLVSIATRLFAFAVDASEEPPTPVNQSVSPTEAVALASALLRAHDLNPFDLAAWHTRARFSERQCR